MTSDDARILFVDDEPNLLSGIRRQFGRKYRMDTAESGPAGLEKLSSGPFAVVVSDMRMPGMNGVEFLAAVKERHPEVVRVMLTGNADLATAVHAVNEGSIFRFTTKPCPPAVLEKIITASLEQYRLQRAEKDLLEQTLKGAIRILVDTLSLTNPVAFSRASRLRYLTGRIARAMGIKTTWRYEIAAMLSQVGCVTVPPDILEKSYSNIEIMEDEQSIIEGFPETGHALIANIPRLEAVAEMIRDQRKSYIDTIDEKHPAGERSIAQLGADILRAASAFDSFLLQGKTRNLAYYRIEGQSGKLFNPAVVEAMKDVDLPAFDKKMADVKVNGLYHGMRIEEDVVTRKGILLIQKGQEVTNTVKTLMLNYHRQHAIKDSFLVSIPVIRQ